MPPEFWEEPDHEHPRPTSRRLRMYLTLFLQEPSKGLPPMKGLKGTSRPASKKLPQNCRALIVTGEEVRIDFPRCDFVCWVATEAGSCLQYLGYEIDRSCQNDVTELMSRLPKQLLQEFARMHKTSNFGWISGVRDQLLVPVDLLFAPGSAEDT